MGGAEEAARNGTVGTRLAVGENGGGDEAGPGWGDDAEAEEGADGEIDSRGRGLGRTPGGHRRRRGKNRRRRSV